MSTQILIKGSLSKEKRHDGSLLPIDYLGLANFGTPDSAPFWDVTKLTIGADGVTITVQTALGAWDQRYILPYV
jgi:hypothetical protein